MAEKAVAAVVSGRVQGVGFRWATRRAAQALGVSGWVANAPDGTVHAFAQGDEESVDEFVTFLRHGPPGATVTDVEVSEKPTRPGVLGFDIRH
jgi:acylphosphatase